MVGVLVESVVHAYYQQHDDERHRYEVPNQELTTELAEEFFCFHLLLLYFGTKVHKKTERSKEFTLLLSILTHFLSSSRITFRDSRQKLSTSCGP